MNGSFQDGIIKSIFHTCCLRVDRGILTVLLLLVSGCSWVGSERDWNNPYDVKGTRPAGVPIIDSVPHDTSIIINDTLEMSFSASCTNATVTKYHWSFDDGTTAVETDAGTLEKIWEPSDSGIHTVSIRAENEWEMISDPETFSVKVRSCYPVLTVKPEDAAVSQLAVVERSFSATDSNGAITSYFWGTGNEGWDDSASGDEAVTVSFDNPEGGTVPVRWAARDDDGLMVYDTFIVIFNRRPISVGVTSPAEDTAALFQRFDIAEGIGDVVCSFSADDPDEGDVLTYTFFCGPTLKDTVIFYSGKDTSVILSGVTASTEYVWTLTVKDLFGDSTSATGAFTTAPPPKAPDGMVLIRARGICYEMGQSGFSPAEEPIHQVCFNAHFWMDSTEVTYDAFSAVTGTDISNGNDGDMPVANVSWYDAALYCNARSKSDGKDTVYLYTSRTGDIGRQCSLEECTISATADGYRLPTEAEWEYACKSDSLTLYFWGNDRATASLYAWTKENSAATVHQVADKLPNGSQLYDMSGNVWEWCQDWYDAGFYTVSERVDPQGPETGTTKVIRGGSWNTTLFFAQAGTRVSMAPESGDPTIGFRTVLIIR